MARKRREISGMGMYHILLRGVNSLFLTDSDFEAFLSILKAKTKPCNVKVLCYLLLENRVHMIIDVQDKNVSVILKPICTSFARYCNRTRGVSGKLFYDRFKSEPINSKEELLSAVSFINFIAKGQGDSKFSSLVNPICSAQMCGMTEKQAKSTELTRMFMEDYDCLSKEEIKGFVYAMSGGDSKDFEALSAEKQLAVIDEITKDRRISKSKIYEVLGVRKPQNKRPKKTEEFNDQAAEKKNLSVWLL